MFCWANVPNMIVKVALPLFMLSTHCLRSGQLQVEEFKESLVVFPW